MWIGFFEWLGRFCYDAADPIIALYEANRLRQVADGAIDERTFNIPNGISLARFTPLEERVACRMIHAAGMVELAAHIHFSPDFAAAAEACLAGGAKAISVLALARVAKDA